jgi:hypothetical protein
MILHATTCNISTIQITSAILLLHSKTYIYALHSQYYEKLSLEYMIEQIGIVQFVGRI